MAAAPRYAASSGRSLNSSSASGLASASLLAMGMPFTAARTATGRVDLAAEVDGDRVRIEVRDDGPGVPAELREKVFTPFFTTREKGTGLGLAFVREIVRDHDSEVVVRDAPGGGSVFSFELPRAEGKGHA